MNDSIVGMSAWIVDKLWRWSDKNLQSEDKFNKLFTQDDVITNLILYWNSTRFGSTVREYKEGFIEFLTFGFL